MRKMIYLIVVLFLPFSVLYSEILSWEDALKEAKQNNLKLKQAELNLEETNLKLKRAKSELYPQIFLGSSVNKTYKENYESDIIYSYNASLSYTLFSGFSRINNLKLQTIELQISQENLRRQLSDLISEIKQEFFSLYYCKQKILLAEKILKRRQQNYELIKFKYESGREDLGNLLRVEADFLYAKYELENAKRNYEITMRKFLKTIGKEIFNNIEINVDSMPAVDIKPLFTQDTETLISQTPEYKIKYYQLEKNKIQQKIIKSAFYPTASFSLNYLLTDTKPIPDKRNWSLSLALRATYNIFNGFKDLTDLKIANINIKTAEIELKDTKLNLQNNFYILKNNIVDLEELVAVREKYLKALETQAEIVSIKYTNGIANYYDWYQTEESYINMQKNLLNLKEELMSKKIELKKFLGDTE